MKMGTSNVSISLLAGLMTKYLKAQPDAPDSLLGLSSHLAALLTGCLVSILTGLLAASVPSTWNRLRVPGRQNTAFVFVDNFATFPQPVVPTDGYQP